MLIGPLLVAGFLANQALGYAVRPSRPSRTIGPLEMGLDIPLIPAIAISTAAIFAVFSIDNKMDLTDEGVYKAKKMKRDARLAEGRAAAPKNEDADPFAWKNPFAEEDDDLDIFPPKKKSGGGCG